MTWPRATPGSLKYVKQDSMGIAAATDFSSNAALMELRQEMSKRDICKKELEFLEKGRNPLDFDHSECVPSTDIVVRILVSVQPDQITNMAPLARNGETCESNEEVHKGRPKKTLPPDRQKTENGTSTSAHSPVANGVLKVAETVSSVPKEELATAAHQGPSVTKVISELVESLSVPEKEPPRSKTHWDFVLLEMEWMANDFMQERLWKKHAAFQIAYDAAMEARKWPRLKETCPDVPPEPVQRVSLVYTVPHGATEAYRQSVEVSWASKGVSLVQEETSLDSRIDERTRQPLESSEDEFYPVSNSRVRQRPEKRPKKRGPNRKTTDIAEETDSENEWIPDSPEKVKRKKVENPPVKSSSYKKAQAPVKGSTKDMRRNSLRKGDLFQPSFNQPGQEWCSQEDQCLVILESDLGSNWNWLSDILNTGWQIKGRYRTAEKCKERHAYLVKHMHVQRSHFDGPPGTSMVILEKIHRPAEKDAMIYHFEQLREAKEAIRKKRLSENPKPNILRDVLLDSHESTDHAKYPYMSPLEHAEAANEELSRAAAHSQKRQSKTDLIKDLGRGDKSVIAALQEDDREQKVSQEKHAFESSVQQHQQEPSLQKLQQNTPKLQLPPCATSQQHLGGPSPTSLMEQQRRSIVSAEPLQQNYGSGHRQRVPQTSLGMQVGPVTPTPVTPLPPCSTSHQQVLLPPASAEQQQHFQHQGHQHLQIQRGVRMPQQPTLQPGMQGNLQYNHRGLTPLAQGRFGGNPPVQAQWRSSGMYNHMPAGPRPNVVAGFQQQPRLQNGAVNSQLLQQHQQQLQLQRRLRLRGQSSNGQAWPMQPQQAPGGPAHGITPAPST